MSIVTVLGESAVRSLALAAAVAVALRVLRVQHALLAKRVWTAVLVLSLAMPALVALHIPSVSFLALWSTPRTIIVPATSTASSYAARIAPTRRVADSASETYVPLVAFAPAVSPDIPVPAVLRGAPASVRHIPIWQIGFAAYLVITALLILRAALGLVLARRLWRRAQSFTTAETDLPVRLSVDLRSPATVGHGILLPLEAIEWDGATLRATLAHEVQHVREGDFYLQLAATLHHCFFWISPHAWWMRPQLSRLSETICDRAAVASSGDGLSYAQLLIRFATAEQTPAGMVAMAQSAGLRERVERLIADPQLAGAFRKRRGQAICTMALLAGLALVAAATVHIIQPETAVLAAPQAPAAPPNPAAPPPESALPAPDVASPAIPAPAPSPDAVSPRIAPAAPVDPPQPIPPVAAPAAIPDVAPVPQLEPLPPLVGDANSYVIYGPDSDHTVMMHGWFDDADRMSDEHAKHPGGAILFRRDGKTWIIDNPELVKQAQKAYDPVNELAKKQGDLGAKQGELGAQQGDLGALEGALARQDSALAAQQAKCAEDVHIELPKDFDQTVAKLTESEMKLAFNQDKLSEEQRAAMEVQRKEARDQFEKEMQQLKLQQPQRDAVVRQMRENAEQMREQMEPLMKQMREMAGKQSELGRLQDDLGRQQGLLGREQGRASREADERVRSLIDQAVRDGSAHPVQ